MVEVFGIFLGWMCIVCVEFNVWFVLENFLLLVIEVEGVMYNDEIGVDECILF